MPNSSSVDRNSRLRVDPSEWAARRKEAMVRARKNREHRIPKSRKSDDIELEIEDSLEEEVIYHSQIDNKNQRRYSNSDCSTYEHSRSGDDIIERDQQLSNSHNIDNDSISMEVSRRKFKKKNRRNCQDESPEYSSVHVSNPSLQSRKINVMEKESREKESPLSFSSMSISSSFPLKKEQINEPNIRHTDRLKGTIYQDSCNMYDKNIESTGIQRDLRTNSEPDTSRCISVREDASTGRPARGRGRGRGRGRIPDVCLIDQNHPIQSTSRPRARNNDELSSREYKQHNFYAETNQEQNLERISSRKKEQDVFSDPGSNRNEPHQNQRTIYDENQIDKKRKGLQLQDEYANYHDPSESREYSMTSADATNESNKLALLKTRLSFRKQHFDYSKASGDERIPKFPWASQSKSVPLTMTCEHEKSYLDESGPQSNNRCSEDEANGFEKNKRKDKNSNYSPDPDWDYNRNKGVHSSSHKELIKDGIDQDEIHLGMMEIEAGEKDRGHRHKISTQYQENSNEKGIFRNDSGQNEEVVDIETIYCTNCDKSFAPPTYKKICMAMGKDGNPKCLSMYNSKRKVFSSAKARITNNQHLNKEEQRAVITARKKVVSQLKSGYRKRRSLKWKEQSNEFRDSMRTNRLIAKAQKEGKPVDYYL